MIKQTLVVVIPVPPAFLEDMAAVVVRKGHRNTHELRLGLELSTRDGETMALINAIEPAAFLAALTMAAEAVDVGLKMMLFGVRQGEGMLEIVEEEPVAEPPTLVGLMQSIVTASQTTASAVSSLQAEMERIKAGTDASVPVHPYQSGRCKTCCGPCVMEPPSPVPEAWSIDTRVRPPGECDCYFKDCFDYSIQAAATCPCPCHLAPLPLIPENLTDGNG